MVEYSKNFQITEPGIHYNMPAEIYHSDPCPTPSLSNSLIRDLLDKSPKHAAFKHPRLMGKHSNEPTKEMIRGSILHKLFLGKGDEIQVIYADDFRNKKAQEERQQALLDHRLPVLEKDHDNISVCFDVAYQKMFNHPACEGFFSIGDGEYPHENFDGLNEDGEKRSTYLDDVTHFMILPTQKPKQAKSYEPWKA